MDKDLIIKIQRLRESGYSYGDIATKLLITKSQANYYSKINLKEWEAKISDKDKYIQNVCELGKKCSNINQILKIIGKTPTNEYYNQIKKILEDNNIELTASNNPPLMVKSDKKKNVFDYLVKNSKISVSKLRNRILKEKIKEYKCEKCGLSEWEGHDIPLQLHHINGDRNDNRLENIQILCPNCHALTDNYCGRKKKKDNNKCKVCGKQIGRNSNYCRKCYNLIIKKQKTKTEYIRNNGEKCKYPQKNELLEAFKRFGSFRSVGTFFGVSDKTIVKWCEKEGLPVYATELRKYVKKFFNENLNWHFTKGNVDSLKNYQKNKFKKVCLLNANGEIEKIYNSYSELKKDGYSTSSVNKVCKGKYKTHKNRVFAFLDKYKN